MQFNVRRFCGNNFIYGFQSHIALLQKLLHMLSSVLIYPICIRWENYRVSAKCRHIIKCSQHFAVFWVIQFGKTKYGSLLKKSLCRWGVITYSASCQTKQGLQLGQTAPHFSFNSPLCLDTQAKVSFGVEIFSIDSLDARCAYFLCE